MAMLITAGCIACGVCEAECPNEAITVGGGSYAVRRERCTECWGFAPLQRCALACPVNAVVADPTAVEGKAELVQKYQRRHPVREPVAVDRWVPPDD